MEKLVDCGRHLLNEVVVEDKFFKHWEFEDFRCKFLVKGARSTTKHEKQTKDQQENDMDGESPRNSMQQLPTIACTRQVDWFCFVTQQLQL